MTRRRLPPGLLAAALLGGLASLSSIALTATSGWLIVQASYQPVILTLLTAIVGVRAFGIARPALRYAERLRSHDVALADLARRRVGLYDRLIPLTPARLGRRGRAELLGGVVDDLEDDVYAQVRVVVPVLSATLAAGVAAVGAAVLLPRAGLVLTALLLAAAVAGAAAWALEGRHQQEWLAARAEATRVAALVTSRALELQAVGGGDVAARWLDRADRRLTRAATRQARGRALVTAALPAATALSTVATAAIVAAALRGGLLHPATGALLVLTPLAVGDALGILPDAMSGLARAGASRTRLTSLLAQTPAVRDALTGDPGHPAHPPRLRLDEVTAAWSTDQLGGRHDLGPITLDLAPGEHVAITGPNGCGKSTLLAVLARHLDPTGGRYRVDDQDVRDRTVEQTRSLVAFLDDEPHVFASTLRENLRLARPGATDAQLHLALRQAGLARWSQDLPDGLDTRLGEGGRGVSGGERTRLGLARALLSERPVLLLDEPVAQLDHATATSVLADLHHAARGRTVLVVSHRPEGLADFDRVLDLAGADERAPTARVGS
ncbi:thiol reductant ABC exporter subunit CydC [Segeticoccus rhizosphaerae]|uniref:thiol reductant ABC exporter subunit CydC n=1 Tax=Segeticoccus rhizosphaerae TaxID=1104777 RepID=UPI0010C09221|nr:thiol reductant ABC exporter subunit CydC [Ornithinicoccus soli]